MTRSRLRARHRAVVLAVALLLLPVLPLAGSGPARASTAEVDHALVFDGSDGSAAEAGGDVIPTGVGAAFTVEAWVLDDVANDGTWRHIVSQGQGGTAFYLGTANNSQQIRAGDTWTATGVSLPVGRWVHIALTTPGDGTARLYLDGRLEATSASGFGGPTVSAENGPFRLGTQRDLTQAWNGRIDTVRVWSVERTQSEIAGAMHAAVTSDTSGLVAQYLANEGTGATVEDTVSPGADLTLAGGVTWTPVAATTTVGTDTVVSFPRSAITVAGGWTVPDGFVTADLLVVAGGGGGGAGVGGGGGAGGMVEASAVPVTPGDVVPITVGVGGRGASRMTTSAPDGFTAGTNGQDSLYGMTSATGGGVGASWTDQAAGAGGSGGGEARMPDGTVSPPITVVAAPGVDGQGSAGGIAGSNDHPHPTGGGGGADGVGADGSGLASGDGGPGRSSSITGTPVTYAGGGGGGSHGTWSPELDPDAFDSPGFAGDGGAGGGGAGAAATAPPEPEAITTVRGGDGIAGLGGGGGGAGSNCGDPCQTSIGGRGGSGVVIVRLKPSVASALAIDTQPVAGGASGAALTTQPVVHIVDGDGRLIVGDSTTTVTATVVSGGGTLGGTTTVTAVNGVATFADLALTAADGVDQVLRFTSTPVLTSVDASAIRVATPAPPAPPAPAEPDAGATPTGPTPTSVPAGEGGPTEALTSTLVASFVLAVLAALALLRTGASVVSAPGVSRTSRRDRAPRLG